MTLDEFKASLASGVCPAVPAPLRALWEDAQGHWDRAHEIAQDIDDEAGAWVHAYLHRREGDQGNAAYWYRRAGRPKPSGTLELEWEEMVVALLRQSA